MSNLEREVESYVGEPRVPCTGNGGNGCKLLEHRTSVNQILLEAGLEIREDDRHPGGLRMAVTHISVCNSPVWDEPRAWLNNQSLKLARNLIFHHCCFTAIETYSTVPWPYWMRQALRRSCALKSFTVHLVLRVDAHQNDHQDIFRLLYSLKSPVELVFEMAPSTLHTTRVPIRGKIPEKTLRHMTTLRAENLIITPPNARAFLCVLLDNHTITDLGVHACVFRRLPRDSGALFALYLTRRRAALKKLTLADFHCCGDQALWMRLIPALSEMTALEELDVHVSLELEI
ncbi:hypothetical protein HPB50_024791 [Hyalomma asiaticum]|uniref:Uncharacterized protein n=1 Tax=Hyalomma asiaticum TaxID=266040 RepID=A0ACB7TBR9_HYAAI|nr:hypothetical protein HPB50_024791 [Hyalomma asiaticum]